MQDLFSCLPKDASTIDLQQLFFRLTFDNVVELLLNEKVSSLSCQPESPLHKIIEAFDNVGSLVNRRAALGPLLPFYRDTEMNATCKILHDFVDRIIEKAYIKRKSQKSCEPPCSFLESILDSTDDLIKIRFEVLGLLLAGRDTAASVMSNLFFVLARRPDIWKRLQTEVECLEGRKPTYDDIKCLKYHRQVIDESKCHACQRMGLRDLLTDKCNYGSSPVISSSPRAIPRRKSHDSSSSRRGGRWQVACSCS